MVWRITSESNSVSKSTKCELELGWAGGDSVGVGSRLKVLVRVKYWVRVETLVTPSSTAMGRTFILKLK